MDHINNILKHCRLCNRNLITTLSTQPDGRRIRVACPKSSTYITAKLQERYHEVVGKQLEVDDLGANRVCSKCRARLMYNKIPEDHYNDKWNQLNTRQTALLVKNKSRDCHSSCTWCPNKSDIISTQGQVRKLPEIKTNKGVKICGKPINKEGGLYCQMLSGRGIRRHSCSKKANAKDLLKRAKSSGTVDYVVQKAFIEKERLINKLKAKSNSEIELKGLGRYKTRIKRTKTKAEKKMDVDKFISVIRDDCSSRKKLKRYLKIIKWSGGTAASYKNIIMELEARVAGLHATKGIWLRQSVTANQFKNGRVQQRRINEGEIPKLDSSIKDIRQEGTNKFSFSKYVGISFVQDIDKLIERTKKIRNLHSTKNSDYVLKFVCDGGGGYVKLALQLHLAEDLKNPNYTANSIKTLQILSIANADESYELLSELFSLGSIDRLANSGYQVYIVGDLKLTSIIMGLTAGNSSFPCPKCVWNCTNRDADHFKESAPRNLQQWQTNLASVNAGGLPKLNNSVKKAPISWRFVEQDSIIVPPELHISEGVVNKAYDFIQNANTETSDLWAKAAGVYIKGYHGGKFTGGQCRKLISKLDIITAEYPEISKMLAIFKEITGLIFQCAPIDSVDIDSIARMIASFTEAYKQTGMSVTHKVHWFMFHCVDHIRSTGILLGNITEQDIESLHAFYPKYDNYNASHINYHYKGIEKWNSERFGSHPGNITPASLLQTHKKANTVRIQKEIDTTSRITMPTRSSSRNVQRTTQAMPITDETYYFGDATYSQNYSHNYNHEPENVFEHDVEIRETIEESSNICTIFEVDPASLETNFDVLQSCKIPNKSKNSISSSVTSKIPTRSKNSIASHTSVKNCSSIDTRSTCSSINRELMTQINTSECSSISSCLSNLSIQDTVQSTSSNLKNLIKFRESLKYATADSTFLSNSSECPSISSCHSNFSRQDSLQSTSSQSSHVNNLINLRESLKCTSTDRRYSTNTAPVSSSILDGQSSHLKNLINFRESLKCTTTDRRYSTNTAPVSSSILNSLKETVYATTVPSSSVILNSLKETVCTTTTDYVPRRSCRIRKMEGCMERC